MGIEIDLSLVWGSKWLGFGVWIELDLISVQGSRLTRFWCRNWNILGSSVGIEMNLVLVLRHQNIHDFIAAIKMVLTSFSIGIRINLFFGRGAKITWFTPWIEITLVLCGGVEIGLILEWGSNWHDFSSGVGTRIVFVWGSDWLGFSVGIQSDLLFVRGIEIDGVLDKIVVLSVIDGIHFGVGSGGRNCLAF